MNGNIITDLLKYLDAGEPFLKTAFTIANFK